jgi:galactokinase
VTQRYMTQRYMTQWYQPSSSASVAAAVGLFTASFGGTPDGVWSAPGRVNLIGEHVDYAGGICLPFALPHRTFAAARARDDGVLRLVSGQLGEPWTGPVADVRAGQPAGWAGYPAGVAWALRTGGLLTASAGADVAVHSDVPVGAGLSSSAALECAVAMALAELSDRTPLDLGALVRAGIRAENEIVGAATGGMDQAVAVHARAGHCLRLDCLSWELAQVPLPLAEHDLAVLVINTNTPHRLVDSEYSDRRAGVERACELLGVPTLRGTALADALAGLAGHDPALIRYARHVITETRRADQASQLLRAGRITELGPLLTASHASLRDDYRISCRELDVAVAAATEAGALGARMVGGGFGGSAIALVAVASVDAVAAAVTDAAARCGLPVPAFLRAEADGPTRRECGLNSAGCQGLRPMAP